MPTKEEKEVVALLASLFQERGIVVVRCRGSGRYLQTSLYLRLVDAQVLEMFKKYLGGEVRTMRGNTKEWQVSGTGGAVAARTMLPYIDDPYVRLELLMFQEARNLIGISRGLGSNMKQDDIDDRADLCRRFEMARQRRRLAAKRGSKA